MTGHETLTAEDPAMTDPTRPDAIAALRGTLVADFASAFIRIRGAHNPDPGEPCAWCRLAAEQAAEAVVTTGIAARLTAAGVTVSPPSGDLAAALTLLNSLGIAGPNIRHAIQTEPDPKWDDDERAGWEMTKDQTWCVCGRVWPCEALALDTIIRSLALRPTPAPETSGLREALSMALNQWRAYADADREREREFGSIEDSTDGGDEEAALFRKCRAALAAKDSRP